MVRCDRERYPWMGHSARRNRASRCTKRAAVGPRIDATHVATSIATRSLQSLEADGAHGLIFPCRRIVSGSIGIRLPSGLRRARSIISDTKVRGGSLSRDQAAAYARRLLTEPCDAFRRSLTTIPYDNE